MGRRKASGGIYGNCEEMMMEELEFYIPKLEELWFYQKMMEDPDTMSYNAGWDVSYKGYHKDTGVIDFPREEWEDWYSDWIGNEPERFFAYIKRSRDGEWIGNINFHHNKIEDWWDMGIVIYAPYRGNGYSNTALKMLMDHAFNDCGVTALHNDFEPERVAARKAHIKAGFRELGVENGICQLKITKEEYMGD
ncbi:MAG: GNAT family N-acetyltransferase [Lachnospiraceae bacterium]|nr:GNAT family N-acetyltransferase [Lachnospiraceae bacterium]